MHRALLQVRAQRVCAWVDVGVLGEWRALYRCMMCVNESVTA